MKINKQRAGQAGPAQGPKQKAKLEEIAALHKAESDPDEIILCVPGGKCYTRAELAALEKPVLPLFEMEGESDDAES